MKKIRTIMVMSLMVVGSIAWNMTYASYNSELDNAISRLYNNGLTNYASSRSFRSGDPLTREQFAKFIVWYNAVTNQMLNAIMYNDVNYNCQFRDIYKSDSTLVDDIYSACTLWLMQGGNWYFSPKQYVTNEQFVAVLMRMTHGYQNEQGADWSAAYYQQLVNENMFNDLDIFSRRSPITRGEVAIMLYRTAGNIGYTGDPVYYPSTPNDYYPPYNPNDYFPSNPVIIRRWDIAFTSISSQKDNYTYGTLYHQFTLTNTGNTSITIHNSDYIKCQTIDRNGSLQSMIHYLPAVILSAKNVLTVKASISESNQLMTNRDLSNSTICTAYIANDANGNNNAITVRNTTLYQSASSTTTPDLVVDQIRIRYMTPDQQPAYEILLRNRGSETAYINSIHYLTINGITYTTPITLGYNQSTWLALAVAPASNGSTYIMYNGSEVDTSNNQIPAFNSNTLINDYYSRTNNRNNNNNNNYNYGTPDFKIINTHLRYNNNGQFSLGVDLQNIGQAAYTTRLGVSCTLWVNNGNSFPINYDNACLETSSTAYYGWCTNALDNGATASVQFTNIYGINYGDNVSVTCTVNPNNLVNESNYNNNTYTKSFYSPYNDY